MSFFPLSQDVKMQSIARQYAKKFNSIEPPQKIKFVKAWVIELVDRNNKPKYGMEKWLKGDYVKHNNNVGYVNQILHNTPQAYSHFTYQESGCKLLVCPIPTPFYNYIYFNV